MDRINRYTRAARVYYNLNRWVCVRIDTISGLFAAGLGAYLVYFQNHSPSNIGFSLNMAGELDVQVKRSGIDPACSWIQWHDPVVDSQPQRFRSPRWVTSSSNLTPI